MILPRQRPSIHSIVQSFERTIHDNNGEAQTKQKGNDGSSSFVEPNKKTKRHPSLTDDSSSGGGDLDYSHTSRTYETSSHFDDEEPIEFEGETTIEFFGEQLQDDDDEEETTIVFGSSSAIASSSGEEDKMMNRLDNAHKVLASMTTTTTRGGPTRRATLHNVYHANANDETRTQTRKTRAPRRITFAQTTTTTSQTLPKEGVDEDDDDDSLTKMLMNRLDYSAHQGLASMSSTMWTDNNNNVNNSDSIEGERELQKIDYDAVQQPKELRSKRKARQLSHDKIESQPKLPSLFPSSMATCPTKLARDIRRRKSAVWEREKAREKEEEATRKKAMAEASAAAEKARLEEEEEERQKAEAEAAEKARLKKEEEERSKAEKAAAAKAEAEAEKSAKQRRRSRRRSMTSSSSNHQKAAAAGATAWQTTRRNLASVVGKIKNGKRQDLDDKQQEEAMAAGTSTSSRSRRATFSHQTWLTTRRNLASVVVDAAVNYGGRQFLDKKQEETQEAITKRSIRSRTSQQKERVVAKAQTTRRDLASIVGTIKNGRENLNKQEENEEDAEKAITRNSSSSRRRRRTVTTGASQKPKPKPDAVATRKRNSTTTPKKDKVEQELDEEIKALEAQIAKLQGKLEETAVVEETEIKSIQQETQKQKEEYRIEKGVLSKQEKTTLMTNTVKRGVTLRAMKRIIMDMQTSNRNYRMVIQNLSANMEELYDDNHELKQSLKWSRIQALKNSTKFGDEENYYFGVTEHLPDYRHWIEGLRKEQVRRERLIQLERSVLSRYSQTMDSILSLIFERMTAAEEDLDNKEDHQEFVQAILRAKQDKKHFKSARKAVRKHNKSRTTIVYQYLKDTPVNR